MNKSNVVMGLLVVGLVLTAVNISLKMRDQIGTQNDNNIISTHNLDKTNMIPRKAISFNTDAITYKSLDIVD